MRIPPKALDHALGVCHAPTPSNTNPKGDHPTMSDTLIDEASDLRQARIATVITLQQAAGRVAHELARLLELANGVAEADPDFPISHYAAANVFAADLIATMRSNENVLDACGIPANPEIRNQWVLDAGRAYLAKHPEFADEPSMAGFAAPAEDDVNDLPSAN